jgi:hypothetical protein
LTSSLKKLIESTSKIDDSSVDPLQLLLAQETTKQATEKTKQLELEIQLLNMRK